LINPIPSFTHTPLKSGRPSASRLIFGSVAAPAVLALALSAPIAFIVLVAHNAVKVMPKSHLFVFMVLPIKVGPAIWSNWEIEV
jgi:hypothetical protein